MGRKRTVNAMDAVSIVSMAFFSEAEKQKAGSVVRIFDRDVIALIFTVKFGGIKWRRLEAGSSG